MSFGITNSCYCNFISWLLKLGFYTKHLVTNTKIMLVITSPLDIIGFLEVHRVIHHRYYESWLVILQTRLGL